MTDKLTIDGLNAEQLLNAVVERAIDSIQTTSKMAGHRISRHELEAARAGAAAGAHAMFAAIRKAASDRKLVRSWYRSVTPDGTLWCEASDPHEVLDRTNPDEPLAYQRYDVYEITAGWQPWDAR